MLADHASPSFGEDVTLPCLEKCAPGQDGHLRAWGNASGTHLSALSGLQCKRGRIPFSCNVASSCTAAVALGWTVETHPSPRVLT